jgi:hypothetical protein
VPVCASSRPKSPRSAVSRIRLSAAARASTWESGALRSPSSRTWTASCPALFRLSHTRGERFSSTRNLMQAAGEDSSARRAPQRHTSELRECLQAPDRDARLGSRLPTYPRDHAKHADHRKPHTPDTGLTIHLVRLDTDAIMYLRSHGSHLTCRRCHPTEP